MYEQLDRKIDRSREQGRVEMDADVILKNQKKQRIQENDFKEIFGEEDVNNDIKTAARIKEKFSQQIEHLSENEIKEIRNGEKLGHVLEIVIAEAGEEYGWAGQKSRFILASTHDDVVNGVDVILELVPIENKDFIQPQRVALAIDTSRNKDTYALSQKVTRNINKITGEDPKKFAGVKYFQSAINKGIKSNLEIVIPVVIGLEAKNANDLIHSAAVIKILEKMADKNDDYKEVLEIRREEMRQNPAQMVFNQEVCSQLKCYLKKLSVKNDSRSKIYKEEIISILETFQSLIANKKNIKIGKYETDDVMKTIEYLSAG
jgi:hypothetical protein